MAIAFTQGLNPFEPGIQNKAALMGLAIIRNAPDSLAIMQAGNLYVAMLNNPVFWIDPTGLFVTRAQRASIANFVTNNAQAIYTAVAGTVIIVCSALIVKATFGAATPLGAAGIAKGATMIAGATTAATIGTAAALKAPAWVTSAGAFVSWAKHSFEQTKQVLNLAQTQQLFEMAKQFGVKITADKVHLTGHPGTNWEIPHIHLGDARVHIAISKDAVEWVLRNLP